MCVIMVTEELRPTPEMVRKAWNANPHGFGIAWYEQDGKTSYVRWQKGVTKVEEALALCANTPLPYVAHFRVASVGGVKDVLTHPFIVSKTSPLMLKGRTRGCLLFHNGHWGVWAERALEAAINSNSLIPSGDWSDSRAMAWMISIYGPGFMEFLTEQKGVLISPERMHLFTGKQGWERVNQVWCSNDLFMTRSRTWNTTSYTRRVCHIGKCHEEAQPGKNICAKCEAEQNKKVIGPEEKPTAALVVSNKNTTTGGTSNATSSPFQEPKEPFSLQEAEKLQKQGRMSKTMLKKFRREYQELDQPGKKGQKAKENLLYYTKQVAQAMVSVNGSTH